MLLHQRLRPGHLIERSRRRSKLEDFGDWPFQEGLQVFFACLPRGGGVEPLRSSRDTLDVDRLLGNLLRMRAEEGRAPEILDERIERPVFITGLPSLGDHVSPPIDGSGSGEFSARIWQLIILSYSGRSDRGVSASLASSACFSSCPLNSGGSAAINWWRNVVPERGKPVIKTGRSIRSSRISGAALPPPASGADCLKGGRRPSVSRDDRRGSNSASSRQARKKTCNPS